MGIQCDAFTTRRRRQLGISRARSFAKPATMISPAPINIAVNIQHHMESY